jgi:enhancing lycopene biosynthesis protein 2
MVDPIEERDIEKLSNMLMMSEIRKIIENICIDTIINKGIKFPVTPVTGSEIKTISVVNEEGEKNV